MNVKITCPSLTEEDTKGFMVKCLSGLEESEFAPRSWIRKGKK
jgi:hypothetical protein